MIEDDIEAIESGYEFLLAFAAQGRPAQNETGPGPHARPIIEEISVGMKNIAAAFSESKDEFELVIANDFRNAGAAIRFILNQEKIGSEIVDNLNASIHLRAVLTDLFLYSESLTPLDTAEASASSAVGGVETYDATKK